MMARRRDYQREAERRDELARMRGLPNYWAQRNTPRYPSNAQQYAGLPDAALDARSEVDSVLRLARREDITAEEAAVRLGVPMEAVSYWGGDALGPTRHGQTQVTEYDELFRLRPIGVDGSVEFVETRNSKEAEEAERIFSVQWDYLHGRATRTDLDRLPRTFQGRSVVKDPNELKRIGLAGLFADLPDSRREFR